MRDMAWGWSSRSGELSLPGISYIDGVQLGSVKRPRLFAIRIAGEPAETPGAVEELGHRSRALLNGEGRYEQAFRRGVLLHQPLQGFRSLMD